MTFQDTMRMTNVEAWMEEESQTVSSAAVKREEIVQAEDEELLEGSEKTRFGRLVATLNFMSSDTLHLTSSRRRTICVGARGFTIGPTFGGMIRGH